MKNYYEEKNIKVQKLRKIKKILTILLYIIFIPVLAWNLIITVKTIQNPNETPSVFGTKVFCIISGSMEPFISVNDLIIVKEVQQNEINTGDIITFVVNGDTVTHRVKNIENQDGKLIYTTQGDSNNIEDSSRASFEDIEGKYIGKIPKIGKIVIALKNEVTLIIVLLMLVALYMVKQKKEDKKMRRANQRIEYEKENKKE